MEMMLESKEKMEKLSKIQNDIQPTEMIITRIYMCDCTGCENACFESCADGQGPMD